MKSIKNTALFFAALLFAQLALADHGYTWRQDLGYYEGEGLWMGEDFSEYASGDGKTVKYYTKSTISKSLSQRTTGSFSVELTQFELDGFSMGNAKDGKGQTALSEVELAFTTEMGAIGSSNTCSWTVDYGVSAPGSSFENQALDAPGSGVTAYKLGGTLNYAPGDRWGLNFSAAYWFRPGELTADGANNDSGPSLEIPDVVFLSLGVPIYFGANVVSIDLTQKTSQSGVDIGDSQFSDFATDEAPPFPAR